MKRFPSEKLTVVAPETTGVQHDRLITGIAVALGVCATVLVVVAIKFPPVVIVALALGAAAYFMWYQTSGRMARRFYRSVERQARANDGRSKPTGDDPGFGAGPRGEWSPPGGEGRTRRGRTTGQRQQTVSPNSRPTRAQAFEVLGVDPDADDATIKQAYREKVKQVHPDTEGGDQEQFKQVTRAYERLTDGSR